MTERSRFLVGLAEQIAAAYVAETRPCAILLTGSAAEGLSDAFSDLDLIVYHDRLPTENQLAAARAMVNATDARVTAGGDEEGCLEEYTLEGVACQVGHATITAWEREMASVLEEFTPATVVEKAISGLLDGAALHGDDVIARWQGRAAAYPEELARATVSHYLQFFPLWLVADRLLARDAVIFSYQSLVETSLNLLGVLAGLNHLYFSSFQFKRQHQFAARMRHAPERLADRLDDLFALELVAAGAALERLVDETLTLVETHMPEIATSAPRRHVGIRHP